MSRATQLAAARYKTQQGFTETVTFFYETEGEIPPGEITASVVEVPVHAAVPAEVDVPSLNVSDRESAGQLLGVQNITVKVAVGSTPDVREGHLCRVTASTSDVSLVGRVFRVSGWPQAGTVTSHRYPVTEV